jgi:hypothetical protein
MIFSRAAFVLFSVSLFGAATAQQPDVTEAAKRDLQEIKAAGIPTDRAGLKLPEISGPELHGSSPQSRPDVSVRKAREAKASGKSSTWLLDAMDPDRARTEEEEKMLLLTGEKTETELQLEKRFRLPGDPQPASRQTGTKGKSSVAKPQLAGGPPNPLTAFMGAWISQRDHELLMSKPKDVGNGSEALDRLLVSGLQPEITRPTGTFPIGRDFVEALAAGGDPKHPADTNPYLQNLLPNLPEPRMMTGSGLLSGAPSASEPSNLPGTGLQLETNAVKDPVKPADTLERSRRAEDAKYFPQLRRF